MTLAGWSRKLKRRSPAPDLPPLILLTDAARLADPGAAVARLPRGSAVILRDYTYPERAALATRLARLCRKHRLIFLVAGDARLARRLRADGVHLPEHALRRRLPRRPGWLLTAAAHSRAGLRRAETRGVDAVLLSPVFATASHPGRTPLGRRRLAVMLRETKLPVHALGGITPRRMRGLAALPLAGIAGIGLFAPKS